MRFVKRNCKNQTTTNTTSGTSNNNSGIVGNSSNNTSGGGNYTHPTGSLWGNKYTGKEILDGDLTSKGTIQAMTVAGTNVTATNVNSETITGTNITGETITGTNITGETITGTTVNGNTGNFQKANVTDTLSANTALLDNATIKQLYVSGSAHFVELIIDKINSTEGSLILSPAHAELSRVETTGNIVKCYFKATDGEKKITNDFAADDLVICESFNVSEGYNENVSNKFVWKRIIETGTTEDGSEHWFSVYVNTQGYVAYNYVCWQTNSEFESGDIVCVLGNATNDARQDAILLSATNPNFVEIGHCESSEVVGETFEVTKIGSRGVSYNSVYAEVSKNTNDYVFSFTFNNRSYTDYMGLCKFKGYEGQVYELWVNNKGIHIVHYEKPNSSDIAEGYSMTTDNTYFVSPSKYTYKVGYYILQSRGLNSNATYEIKFTMESDSNNIVYTCIYINNNLLGKYHLSGANTENTEISYVSTKYYTGPVTKTNDISSNTLLLNVETINYCYQGAHNSTSISDRTYYFSGTTTDEPTTFTNLITNGTFDGSLDGWKTDGMKLAPTGLAPFINEDENAYLFYPNFAEVWYPQSSYTVTTSNYVNSPMCVYIEQSVGELKPGIYILSFDCASEMQYLDWIKQYKIYYHAEDFNMFNVDICYNSNTSILDAFTFNLSSASNTLEENTSGVHHYHILFKIGCENISCGADCLYLPYISGDKISITFSNSSYANWFAIDNVELYKIDLSDVSLKHKLGNYTKNTITNPIESPAIISFAGINSFSLADKHVSVLSPSYNLISADSVTGLSDIVSKAITDGTLTQQQINDIIDGKFGSISFIDSTNFEQTLLACTDYIQTKESITLKADSATVTSLTNSVGDVEKRVTANESAIQVNADNIKLKASQTDFDALGTRVSSAESAIQVNTDNIKLKASQTDFDTLGNRVSSAESAIQVNTDNIKLKASQTDFDTLGNRVSSAESAIQVNADNIKLKASQTDFDTLTNRVTTAESSITQNATDIKSKVSQTDFNSLSGTVTTMQSTIEQMPDEISLKVEETVSDDIIGQFKTTGIDITNGQVVIDADNTIINGNLELKATNNSDALTLFDDNGVERTTVTSQEIGGLDEQSRDASNAYNKSTTINSGDSTVFDLGTYYYSANSVVYAGTKWTNRVAYYAGWYYDSTLKRKNSRAITSPNSCKLTLKLVNKSDSSIVYTVPSTMKTYSDESGVNVLEAIVDTSNKYVTITTAGTYIVRLEIKWANGTTLSPFTDATSIMVYAYMNSESPSKSLMGADGLYATNGADKYMYYGSDGFASVDAQYISGYLHSMSSTGARVSNYDTTTYTPDDNYLYWAGVTGPAHIAKFKNGGNKWTSSQSFVNVGWMFASDLYKTASTAYKPSPSTDMVIFNDTTSTDYYLDLSDMEYDGHVVEIRTFNNQLELLCSSTARFKLLSGSTITNANQYTSSFYDIRLVYWGISSSGPNTSDNYTGLWVILSQHS